MAGYIGFTISGVFTKMAGVATEMAGVSMGNLFVS